MTGGSGAPSPAGTGVDGTPPGDVLGQDRPPGRWPSRRVLLLVLVAVVTGLVVADGVRDRRAAQELVDLALVRAVPAPGAGVRDQVPREDAVQEPVVVLPVRNAGEEPIRLVEQRLDGGGPVDRTGRSLGAGETTGLDVRWRVLCAEVGSLEGPRRLDLVVRPRRGPARPVSLALDDAARRRFRLAASDLCAAA